MKIINPVPETKKIKKNLVIITVAVLIAAYGILTFLPESESKGANYVNNGEINLTYSENFIDLPSSYADIKANPTKEPEWDDTAFQKTGYTEPAIEHQPLEVAEEKRLPAPAFKEEKNTNALVIQGNSAGYDRVQPIMVDYGVAMEEDINDSPIGYGGSASNGPRGNYNSEYSYTPDTSNTDKLLGALIDKQSSGGLSSQDRYLAQASERKSFDLQERVEHQTSPYTLMAGSIIPSAMMTGINSDLPGELTAQVRENVYDTVTGKYLLIPQGTRLFGSYDSGVLYGQQRVLFTWDRLQFPNGDTMQIRGMKGVDVGGYAGLDADVDNHYGRLMGAILMSAFMAIGTDELNNGTTFRAQMAEDINRSGQKIVDMQLNVKPTLKVPPGARFNIMVNKDIILKPYTSKG
jgi:type IV secretion system protein VirB10